jgi:hypothetical protein
LLSGILRGISLVYYFRSQLPLDVHEGEDPVIPKKTKRTNPKSDSTLPIIPDMAHDTVNEAKRMKIMDEIAPIDGPELMPSLPTQSEAEIKS